MNKPELMIDISQFGFNPARSGIQRVLVESIRHWRSDIVSAYVGFRDSREYTIVSVADARSVLQDHFNGSNDKTVSAARLRARLERSAIAKIAANLLSEHFSAYLLPEPTFRDAVLDVLRHWNSQRPERTFAIFFDALPQTSPQVFPSPHQMETSRYYREISSVENVACISKASLHCLAGRLRRRPISNAVALPLGTTSLAVPAAASPPALPTFVSVGTVEPRKNHPIILAAFDELWRSGYGYRLHFIGARGWQTDSFFKELSDRLAEYPDRFRWSPEAGDSDVHRALAQSTGAIFVSEEEGYGLPAAEALGAGCPLIAAASLPALEDLPAFGQIRLDEVSIDSIKAAVQRLADPEFNGTLRRELTKLRVPTWQDFADQLVGWIRRTLDSSAGPTETLRPKQSMYARTGSN